MKGSRAVLIDSGNRGSLCKPSLPCLCRSFGRPSSRGLPRFLREWTCSSRQGAPCLRPEPSALSPSSCIQTLSVPFALLTSEVVGISAATDVDSVQFIQPTRVVVADFWDALLGDEKEKCHNWERRRRPDRTRRFNGRPVIYYRTGYCSVTYPYGQQRNLSELEIVHNLQTSNCGPTYGGAGVQGDGHRRWRVHSTNTVPTRRLYLSLRPNRYDTGTQRSPTSTLYRSLRLHAPALWLLRRPGLSRWRTRSLDARLRTLNTRTREPYRVYSTQLVLDPGPSCSDSCCGRRLTCSADTCSVPTSRTLSSPHAGLRHPGTSHPHLTPACAIPARRILTSRRLAPSRHVNPQLVEGERAAGVARSRAVAQTPTQGRRANPRPSGHASHPSPVRPTAWRLPHKRRHAAAWPRA